MSNNNITPQQHLEQLFQRKQQIDEDLKAVERQILDMEEGYLEDTNHYGNVLKGWDGFMTSRPKAINTARKIQLPIKDRIFSNTSMTAPITEHDENNEDADGNILMGGTTSSGLSGGSLNTSKGASSVFSHHSSSQQGKGSKDSTSHSKNPKKHNEDPYEY